MPKPKFSTESVEYVKAVCEVCGWESNPIDKKLKGDLKDAQDFHIQEEHSND